MRDGVTVLGTILAAAGSYAASNYDKIFSAALALAGLAFLVWRWRKAARTQLCDAALCPYRRTPAE